MNNFFGLLLIMSLMKSIQQIINKNLPDNDFKLRTLEKIVDLAFFLIVYCFSPFLVKKIRWKNVQIADKNSYQKFWTELSRRNCNNFNNWHTFQQMKVDKNVTFYVQEWSGFSLWRTVFIKLYFCAHEKRLDNMDSAFAFPCRKRAAQNIKLQGVRRHHLPASPGRERV